MSIKRRESHDGSPESKDFDRQAGEIIGSLNALCERYSAVIERLRAFVDDKETESATRAKFIQSLSSYSAAQDRERGDRVRHHDFSGLRMPENEREIVEMAGYYLRLKDSIPIEIQAVKLAEPEVFEGGDKAAAEILILQNAALQIKLLERFLATIEKFLQGE